MDFAERYKAYTNAELLRIIDNAGDYQPSAVDTAKQIFTIRSLSDKEIETARKELEAEKQLESDKEEKINRIKNKASSILDEANPVKSKTPSADKIINIVSILLGMLFVYQIYKEAGLVGSLFTDIGDWDLSVLIFLLPLIILPVSAILFYKRQKSGWILLAIYLTYSAISVLIGMFMATWSKPSGTTLDLLISATPALYLIIFLFYAGMTGAICKNNIRQIYAVSKKTMILTLTITTTAVMLGIIFFISFL